MNVIILEASPISHLFRDMRIIYLLLLLNCISPVSTHAGIPQKGNVPDTFIRDYGVKEYIRLSRKLPHVENTPWDLIAEMPYNCHFQPIIQVEGKRGDTINLNSTNPLVRYLTPTETFTMTAARQSYEAKNWISGEGALYTIPPGVKVISVKYRETGYDTRFAGSFTCNDEDFNILWRKGARTAYICMRDHFYDCPDRERVGFWGDGTPELDQCFYAFDTNTHRLCRELVLRELDPEFYPGQQLEFLGEYGLWYYYMQTGDLESIRKVYPATRNFLFNVYKPGKKKQWFDWGKENKDVAIMETCFMYIDLGSLRKMALITGHSEDTISIDTKMDSIRRNFHAHYWTGSYYKSDQVAEPDDRANAMAVNAGLADRSTWESIYRNVLSVKTYSSCFFDRWVFEALCRMGLEDRALLRMYQRYSTMIPATFTTLWEHYDRWWASHIDAFDEGSSLNHGWNPPVINLSQTIAGISPLKPGWESYAVLPKEAFLKNIRVVVPSVKGEISVEMNKTTERYSLSLHSPASTSAVVGIPKKSFTLMRSIRVNGELIWDKTYTGNVKGVIWYGEDESYVMFSVKAGNWHFTADGKLSLESPKKPPAPSDPGILLDKHSWTARASVTDSSFLFSGDDIPIGVSAQNALDGDHWNGWRDMTRTQYPGQYLIVDMGQTQHFDKVVLDNSWAMWDSPNKYSLQVSGDGIRWGEPIAVGKGDPGMTTITFPEQHARFLRVSQTGQDSTYHWSIYEMDVYRKKTNKTSFKGNVKTPDAGKKS